ncbi:MAG: hypothetical protein LIR46_07785 [Bacteroidota bacterium]|nr:hypothetical protein [Bacteroidota bacterium]
MQVTENFYCADAERKQGLLEKEEDIAPVNNARWIVNKERTEMVCSHCHTRYKNMADEIEAFSTAFRGYYYCSYCGSRTEEIEYR